MADKLEFDHGIAIHSEYDADGVLGIQTDSYGEAEAGAAAAEASMPFGFDGRPSAPDGTAASPGPGCGVLTWFEGSKKHVMPLDDHRLRALLPQMEPGSSRQYCSWGTFHVLDGKTGSSLLFVPYKKVGGVSTKTAMIAVNVEEEGEEVISIKLGDGQGIDVKEDGSVMIRGKKGSKWVNFDDADGLTVAASASIAGGLTVGNGPLTQPVALYPAIQAALAAIVSWAAATAQAPAALAPATALVASLAATGMSKHTRTT